MPRMLVITRASVYILPLILFTLTYKLKYMLTIVIFYDVCIMCHLCTFNIKFLQFCTSLGNL